MKSSYTQQDMINMLRAKLKQHLEQYGDSGYGMGYENGLRDAILLLEDNINKGTNTND